MLVHDLCCLAAKSILDDPGIHLTCSEDKLALLYNDASPLENHHLATAFSFLREDQCNFVRSMPQKDRVSRNLLVC